MTLTGSPAARSARPGRHPSPALVLRVVFGAIGVAIMLVALGGILRDRGETHPLGLAIWLGGGIVLHDFVLAPVVLALGLVIVRVVPLAVRAPVVVGLITAGTLLLIAVPVIVASHRSVANPTVLPGSYVAGLGVSLLVVAALTAVAAAWSLARGRQGSTSVRPPEPD